MKVRFHIDSSRDLCCRFSGKPIQQMNMGPATVEIFLREYFNMEGWEWGRAEEVSDLIISFNDLPEKAALDKFLAHVSQSSKPAVLKCSRSGKPVAWWNTHHSKEEEWSVMETDLIPMRLSCYWDLLELNEKTAPFSLRNKFDNESVNPLAVVEGVLEMGEGSVLLPGVVIEGFVRIGKNCKIGPNAFIRGCTSIGNNCAIGHGVEVKNCLIGNETMIPHLSYLGDSVVGSNVNIGAGCVCSNFRHDAGFHRVMVDGKLVETARQKLGALIGDDVRLGCHTVIYPGRIISSGNTTVPGEIISRNRE